MLSAINSWPTAMQVSDRINAMVRGADIAFIALLIVVMAMIGIVMLLAWLGCQPFVFLSKHIEKLV